MDRWGFFNCVRRFIAGWNVIRTGLKGPPRSEPHSEILLIAGGIPFVATARAQWLANPSHPPILLHNVMVFGIDPQLKPSNLLIADCKVSQICDAGSVGVWSHPTS